MKYQEVKTKLDIQGWNGKTIDEQGQFKSIENS